MENNQPRVDNFLYSHRMEAIILFCPRAGSCITEACFEGKQLLQCLQIGGLHETIEKKIRDEENLTFD